MSDVHDAVRAAIAAELDAWDVVSGLSWSVGEPTPGAGIDDTTGDALCLPKASLWFGEAVGSRSQLTTVGHDSGRAVWRKGRFEGSFMAKVWVDSEAGYQAAREAFETQQLFRATATGQGASMCHELSPTIYGQTACVRIYWSGNVSFAKPRDTSRRDLWELTWEGVLSYPDWVQESLAASTGLLDIGIELSPEAEVDLDDIDADAPVANQWAAPVIDLTETEV